MVSTAQRPAREDESPPAPRVVVALGRPDRDGRKYWVESPDRVLRMLALLTEATDELRLVSLPPQSLFRLRRLRNAVSAEVERSVSPALADELHHLLAGGGTEPDGAELRVELVALLGWISGLAIGMLSQLENATNEPPMASDPAYLPVLGHAQGTTLAARDLGSAQRGAATI
jgi:hypothetical protein